MDSFGTGVDHTDQQDSDRKPFLGLTFVELSISDDAKRLQRTNDSNTDDTLDSQQEEVQVEAISGQDELVGQSHQDRSKTVRQDRYRW